MLYQALYRKYRPKTFDEVCGQGVIVKTLKNTIINNKLTHAYLFIGPRGTGKTSIAKIFAKTINCLNPKDGNSCEKCDICKMCNNNENVDIIEMDAASNNGVDEIREIKNHVTLMPTFSKYKVYIIDEVHMLSAGAFNALLKTLEEPPKHIIFILATTEPQKVPLTIISRCQCFEFKSIPKQFMTEKIKYICNNEKIKIEESAIEQICEDSNGGMRDAIGLLDQLNSYSNSDIKFNDVILLNGRIGNETIFNIFYYIKKNDINSLFDLSDSFEKDGKDFLFICEDIVNYLKNCLVEYQKNNKVELLDFYSKEEIINIIFEITNYINIMKNIKDKKIYFDILLIKILDIINNTNVRDNIIISKEINKNEEQVVIKKESTSEQKTSTVEKKEEVKEIKKVDKIDDKYDNYVKLMDVRLNNILAEADKESLKQYTMFISNLENDLDNLDERKIFNILSDCSIKAGSNDGIIITTSNNNILCELYDSIFDIEKLFNNKLSKDVKLCVYNDNLWNDKRNIYVEKIKNKEKIDILDESKILLSINDNNDVKKSEFDDLLEIGE